MLEAPDHKDLRVNQALVVPLDFLELLDQLVSRELQDNKDCRVLVEALVPQD